jgi:dipeptidyl aminopeptidase/acylaminoacyl peptidase
VVNADGTGARRLTADPGIDSGPAWSPDGQRIAFARRTNSVSNIHAVSSDGSGVVQLTSNPPATFGGDSSPSWSPDGQRLAVSSMTGGHSRIHVINADGSGRTSLSGAADGSLDPAWSPDGRQIAFNQRGHIYVMNADGTNPRRLTGGRLPFYREPDWGTGSLAPRPLTLSVTGPRRQRLDRRNRLHVFATCNRRCFVGVSASVRIGGRRVRSKEAGALLTSRKKLLVKFLRDPARVIRRALGRGKRPAVIVEVKAAEQFVDRLVTVRRRITVRYP